MAKIYDYTANNGYSVKVPAVLHKMIQRGIAVRSVNGGLLTKECQFTDAKGSTVTATVVVNDTTVHVHKVVKATAVKTAQKAAPKAKAVKVAGAKSNADLCRDRVKLAKANGETVDAVVAYNVEVLKQSLSQAKVYAKACWNQVA